LVSFAQITQYFWIFTSKLQIDRGTVAKHVHCTVAYSSTAGGSESGLIHFREQNYSYGQILRAEKNEEEHRKDRLCSSYYMGWLVDICVIVEIL
jgi:hypothetical protein